MKLSKRLTAIAMGAIVFANIPVALADTTSSTVTPNSAQSVVQTTNQPGSSLSYTPTINPLTSVLPGAGPSVGQQNPLAFYTNSVAALGPVNQQMAMLSGFMVLVNPPKTAIPAPTKDYSWTIKDGDTMTEVHDVTGISMDLIAKDNNLMNLDQLITGHTLLIPNVTDQQIAQFNAKRSDLEKARQANASKSVSTAAPSAPAPSPADNAIATAENYLGTPYVFGGETPAGFDCSGFTKYVFAKQGVYIPRSAAAQYDATARVSIDSLQRGDLVFFANTYMPGISHVGIYIGGGRFIQSIDGGVKISNLSSSYYASHYAGAGRVL